MTDITDPATRYEEIATDLAPQGVKRSTMFGMPCLKDVNGKAFAGLHEGQLVCRLGRDTPALEEALRLPGAHLFDPMGGRPMKDWVCIPDGSAGHWENFAEAALAADR
ncbi:hypothetical protein GCM10010193_50930 [Kitasatospora atroaurantiaca]|uniref:TfoX-like protein n=1 Tax=Kitasatospora atroaurantiaca TaxID=285545 RepID=A0A561EY51_9ACTN|nr:hypothetical protein [Kitasatospora atroaurantiaca]TWE20532.1 hypothetical protein FB465_5686 [Kitasatospora atroaurantiaca]